MLPETIQKYGDFLQKFHVQIKNSLAVQRDNMPIKWNSNNNNNVKLY